MSEATKQLAEKENYHELTEKQKAVIDAYAENPDGSNAEIHESANEKLSKEGETISPAYVPVILNKYQKIAYEQKHRKQNGRCEGEERYENIPSGFNAEDDEKTISISLTRKEVESMVEARLPNSIKNKLFNSILESTFSED